MKLLVQPDAGLAPIVRAIKAAKKTIEILIFRFDRPELEKAIQAAVARGVRVRALIAHTNSGGEKKLRKLELKLLETGCTVARTADDLPRYHAKYMLVDDTLMVFGFNFTKLDIEKSRSFGLMTRDPKLVKEARALFEADRARQPFSSSYDRLVVSPDNAREVLTSFIRKAKKQLLIYDAKITDKLVHRVLLDRARAGVDIRILGRLDKSPDAIICRQLKDMRLHVRAIIRDGAQAFVGSQSLRKLELDGRREVGVITTDPRVARQMTAVFESDWAHAKGDKSAEKAILKQAPSSTQAAAAR